MTELGLSSRRRSGKKRKASSPMTEIGSVVTNLIVDIDGIDSARKNKAPLYPGSTDYDIFKPQERDMVFSINNGEQPNNTPDGINGKALNALNGLFSKNINKSQALDLMDFKGYVSSQGVGYDPSGQSPNVFASKVGGSMTVQNGPKSVSSGDFLAFDIPDPSDPGSFNIDDIGRITPHLVPFDPTMDLITEKNLKDVMLNFGNSQYASNLEIPINQAANVASKAIAQLFVTAIHSALASGIVTLNKDTIQGGNKSTQEVSKARQERANKFKVEDYQDHYASLLRELTENNRGLTTIVGNRHKKARTLRETVISAAIAGDDDLLMASLTHTGSVPDGMKGYLVMTQSSNLVDIFSFIESVNWSKQRTIIGKALSSAEPNEDIDIVFGRYSAM